MLRNFFCQNYLFHSSKEVFLHDFRQFLENWIFEGISTGTDLTIMVKIWFILNCAKKIFFVKLIKGSVSPQFLAIIERISTGADLTKMVKIWTILNCAKKIFFVKIICSTHQKKCYSTIFGIFGKLNFWRNIDRRGPYKNGENLNYLKLC